jgi:serine/threonine protein phosphatase PrpC
VLERLTTNHNVDDKSEVQRITKSFNAKFTADGYLAPLNTAHQSYQINITRSIGHQLLFQYGVTYLPTITWHTVDSTSHKSLIMASDGMWNNLTTDQILETVVSIADPQKACDELIASVKELEQYNQDIDNTSVLLGYFGE